MTEHNLARLATIKDGTGHSIFGSSSAHMWLACSGSLIPNILAPDDAGVEAAYGTVAHAVSAEWLSTGKRPDHLVGTNEFIDSGNWGWLIEIDEEMMHYVEQAVDRSSMLQGEHLVEHRVDFSHLTPIPNQGGTLDFAALRPGHITLDDHKFGSSPENIVYAEENPQLMLYAIGLWGDRATDLMIMPAMVNTFTLRINQPRLGHFDEWDVSAKRLFEFGDYVKERAAAAWQIDAPRTPGPKQCRFCRVRATCAANASMQEDLLSGVFGDETPQTVEQMQQFMARIEDTTALEPFALQFASAADLPTAQMARLLSFRGMADAWWKALATELERRAATGEKIPGMKIVEGRTHRKFKDVRKAEQALIELGLSRDSIIKLVSPNAVEKLLRIKKYKTDSIKELLSGLVYKPPGRAALVPLSDRRAEVVDLGALVFEDTENPETREPEEY